MKKINKENLTPSGLIQGEDDDETRLLKLMLAEAEKYLISFNWCGEIINSYLGIGVGGVVAVFLFKITPIGKHIDNCVWVIVGDVPPAYIATSCAPNPACALDAYIGEMQKWINAVNAGESIDNLIPVNVSPSVENAKRLQIRLDFLDKKILSNYLKDLDT